MAEVIEPAIDIARHHSITVYGASFVALAELMGASFVTADGKLAQRLVGPPHLKSLAS